MAETFDQTLQGLTEKANKALASYKEEIARLEQELDLARQDKKIACYRLRLVKNLIKKDSMYRIKLDKAREEPAVAKKTKATDALPSTANEKVLALKDKVPAKDKKEDSHSEMSDYDDYDSYGSSPVTRTPTPSPSPSDNEIALNPLKKKSSEKS